MLTSSTVNLQSMSNNVSVISARNTTISQIITPTRQRTQRPISYANVATSFLKKDQARIMILNAIEASTGVEDRESCDDVLLTLLTESSEYESDISNAQLEGNFVISKTAGIDVAIAFSELGMPLDWFVLKDTFNSDHFPIFIKLYTNNNY
ncbi:Protein of unknown function [Cotesia congregata]|uniref:Uncharacterized protein n=1 Tax=Cotesia congregata TaxID=51543 RepID=A0A8J2HD26_COTCN|nr:Protein of unknown function [Cotesia congregata]